MNLSLEQLKEALNIREQIDALENRLASLFSGGRASTAPVASSAKRGGRRRMTAATRAKMAAAQKARWAKKQGTADTGSAGTSATPKKRRISAAGRKR
jgi:hypothetical protein